LKISLKYEKEHKLMKEDFERFLNSDQSGDA